MDIHIILLAAGNSRRYGENKLLSDFKGKKLYLHLADRLENMHDEITGYKVIVSQYETILDHMSKSGYLPVYNGQPDYGISHSIILGLEALMEKGINEGDAVCFFACDQPYIHTLTIQKFLKEYMKSGKKIGCMKSKDHIGMPVIFHTDYIEELMELSGDVGGNNIVRKHIEDVFLYEAEEKELMDIDYQKRPFVIVRGGGELASGIIYKLYKEGYKVLVLEIPNPICIKRQVSFCEAVYEKTAKVEDCLAILIDHIENCRYEWEQDRVPVLIDEKGDSIKELKPQVVVDAVIAGKSTGTNKSMAPLTIALGSDFEAGKDVDKVVEILSGDQLGKVYSKGHSLPELTEQEEGCMVYSPADGILKNVRQVGDIVTEGELIAYVDDIEVHAQCTGILSGCIKEGYHVDKGLKIINIDPRLEELENCYHISEEAKKIADSVYKEIYSWEEKNFQ